MAEPKRHMDVPKERFSEGWPTHPRPKLPGKHQTKNTRTNHIQNEPEYKK